MQEQSCCFAINLNLLLLFGRSRFRCRRRYFWSRHDIKKLNPKTVRYINSRIWERKRGNYTEALADFQVSAIFNMRDIWRNDLPIFIPELCMEPAPYWYPSGWAQSALWATTCLHAGRNPQKHLLLRLLRMRGFIS